MPSEIARSLALDIANCLDVCASISDRNHPCNKVVSWQASQFSPKVEIVSESKLHRPEPWTGDLAQSKIIFLSSNPSFDISENYPNWESQSWSEEDISQFGAERFSTSHTRGYGATESSDPEFRDRTIGLDGKLSKEVSHWRWVRQFAAFALGKTTSSTSAINDYVMTELVHCKSPHEEGVIQAVSFCTNKWFEKIMEISPAKIIFVTGAKAAEAFVQAYGDKVPNDWGFWANSRFGKGKGLWPRSASHLNELMKHGDWSFEVQKRNICSIKIGGKERMVVYIARPGGGGGINSPWNHENLIHREIKELWQKALNSNS